MKTIEELIIAPMRQEIFDNLVLLPESSQLLFRKIYSHKDLQKPLKDIINDMTEEQLRVAYRQIYNTIHRNNISH